MFLDESGFLLVPNIVRTWAPKGQTPLLRCAGSWSKISAISALSVSPQRKRITLYCRFHPHKNIRSGEVAEFLKYLLRHLRRGFVLLWDGGAIHKGKAVRGFLKRHPRIRAHRFPGYAPELNPDEFVWSQLKRSVANSVPRDISHLQSLLRAPVRRLKHSPKLLWSCLRASELPWR